MARHEVNETTQGQRAVVAEAAAGTNPLLDIPTMKSQIDAIAAIWRRASVPLSTAERRSARKWRPGFEVVVSAVTAQAPKYGVDVPDMPVAQIQADLDAASAAEPLVASAHELLKLVTDYVTAKRASGVSNATTYYSTLSRIGRKKPLLHAAFSAARAFFATGKRTSKTRKGVERAETRHADEQREHAAHHAPATSAAPASTEPTPPANGVTP